MSDGRGRGRRIAAPRGVARALLAAGALALWTTPAAAYIDPGTGSALLYVVTGVIVAAFFAVRGLYYRVVELVFRARHKHQKCVVAIHCESPRYEITFLPVVRELVARGLETTFFTMYERDDSFESLPPEVTHREIAPGMVGYSYLNHLEAEILVTTTPQLDVMTFRRSKRVKHYCHIPHALGESLYVRPYAYDYFDSVFCCGPILENNIRKIESIREFPPKPLYKTGIPHYDVLIERAREMEAGAVVKNPGSEESQRRTVLIAPSWGPLSIFEAFGTDFVAPIAERYDVLVRPHPQMRLSQPELYAEILALDGVTVDTHTTPVEAMSRADLLVSDISGIAHEFAFIHERPVIVIDHEVGLGGMEGQLFGGKSELRERCKDVIIPIPPSEMGDLVTRIDATLEEHLPERIAAVRKDVVYNFGKGGPTAAQQIEEILQCL